MTKKIILSVLSLCLIFAAASCSGQNAEETFTLDMEAAKTDTLDGLTVAFTVALDSGNGVPTDENILGYLDGTAFSDLALERIAQTEKDLDCKIKIENEDYGTFASNFVLSVAVGDSSCDTMLVPSFNMNQWSAAGLLTGITTLGDYIDYRDSFKWGTATLLEATFYKDDLYGIYPASWPELVYSSFGYPLIANMDLLEAVGGDDPRELAENHVWDWDAFNEQLVKCTVIEGDTTKTYALAAHYPYLSEMFFRSNGVSFAEITDNGEYICGYLSDAGRRATEQIRKIYQGELSYTMSKEHTSLSVEIAYDFIDEKAVYAFLPTQFIFGVYGYVSMEVDNFALLPTPVGPDVDADYAGGVYHAMNYTIAFPIMSDITDAAALVIDTLYEPLPGFETLDGIKAYMRHNYFFDDRDADNFFDIFFNSTYNYFYTTGAASRTIPELICSSKEAVSTILEKNGSVMASLFEKTVNDCLDGYKLFD